MIKRALQSSCRHVSRIVRSLFLYEDDSALRPRILWVRLISSSFVVAILFALLYSALAEIDEVAVVPGELKPKDTVNNVLSPVSGRIKHVHFTDGALVRKGQVILSLDPSVSSARLESLSSQLALNKSKILDQQKSYYFRRAQLSQQLSSLANSIDTRANIVQRYLPLVKQGAVQEVQYLEQLNDLQRLQSEHEQLVSRRGELDSEFKRQEKDLNALIAQLSSQFAEAKQLSQYDQVRAPLDGKIFDLRFRTPGDVVPVSSLLFKIVPSGQLEANILVPNEYIGFVRPGVSAQIRVDAYPYTRYGSISGIVKSVSSDSLPPDDRYPIPRFPSVVQLNSQFLERHGTKYQIQSGQTVSVNLILRKRRLITIVSDIFDRSADSLRSVRNQ